MNKLLVGLSVGAKSSRSGQFEDVGSPAKIPRGERTIPKQFPGARRVARCEHNDEEEAEYLDDEVMDDLFGNEEDSDGEQEFKDEDAGPPDLDEDDVLKKDKTAIMVEMEKFERLGVIKLVPLSELKEQEDKEIDWKWLTTKTVFDWRSSNDMLSSTGGTSCCSSSSRSEKCAVAFPT